MGLKITTDERNVTVYANKKTTQNGNKYITYALGISSKDKDGQWVNGFIDCSFKKGVTVSNKSKISITNAFPTVREYNGKTYKGIFVMDFTVVEEGEAPQANSDGFMNIPDGIDDELPFN